MNRLVVLIVVLFSILIVSCAQEIDQQAVEVENPEENLPEPQVDEEILDVPENEGILPVDIQQIAEEPPPNLLNGKTIDERIADAYTNLHAIGSAAHVRENFPDIKVVFVDDGTTANYPSEILPFEYYYSGEANKTFSLCAIERTVLICDGKYEKVATDDDMDSGVCVVTTEYQQSN
jgi:hypothetical protein